MDLPVPASVVSISFHGDGPAVAELSWGQREIWAAMRAQESWLPLGGAVPVPVHRSVDDFVIGLRRTVNRHQSLRTRLRFEPDGGVRQVVSGRGEYPLYVVDVPDDDDPAAVATLVHDAFRANKFDYEQDWPARLAVIRHRGRAAHFVGVFCHFGVDFRGMAALFPDGLSALFEDTGAAPPPEDAEIAGLPPLAQVEWQRSPAGRRLNRATQRHWRRLLARVPARRFADTDDERTPRHWQAKFRSPAGFLAMRSVMARTGTESSPVLMAAVAVALAKITGTHPTVLQVVVHNRFRPSLTESVSPIAQTGLCVVDVAGVTFDEAVENARQSTMSTYLNAYYDPDAMTAMIAELGRERGEEIDLGCFFNDRRGTDDRETGAPTPTPTELAEALSASTLRWIEASHTKFESFFVHVDDAPDALDLFLQADTRCVPPDDMRLFFGELESVLVRAAFDPTAPTGVQPADLRIGVSSDT